ncbi:MAG: glycosyltransferase [Sphingobacterium sp.]|nr:glycosyltransferase [Sphingobacterium sp.]
MIISWQIPNYTAARIKKYWGRDSEILYPPVDTNKFSFESEGDYYFMLGRLVAYKGFELAIEAFNESGKKLIIAGGGPEYSKLKAKAGDNIEMLGKVSDEQLVKYMNNCKAFIFPEKKILEL